jgi:hypothetical protein
VMLGIGCSDKPDAFDPCVPIPGSARSAINQAGITFSPAGICGRTYCPGAPTAVVSGRRYAGEQYGNLYAGSDFLPLRRRGGISIGG